MDIAGVDIRNATDLAVDPGGTLYVSDRKAVWQLQPGATNPIRLPFRGFVSIEAIAIDSAGNDVTSRIHIVSAYQSKGLEYDVVVLLEPADILAEGPGSLYVAMTRPTRQLHVVHAGELPDGLTEFRATAD